MSSPLVTALNTKVRAQLGKPCNNLASSLIRFIASRGLTPGVSTRTDRTIAQADRVRVLEHPCDLTRGLVAHAENRCHRPPTDRCRLEAALIRADPADEAMFRLQFGDGEFDQTRGLAGAGGADQRQAIAPV